MSKDEALSPPLIPQLDINAANQAPPYRSTRPSRACTLRAAARLAQQQQQQQQAVIERKQKKEQQQEQQLQHQLLLLQEQPKTEEVEEEETSTSKEQCGSKVVTQLLNPPEPAQLPRWTLRSMWEMASVLNFLNVFRDQLHVQVEFSAEELETALIMPNDTLCDLHIPLLKAIPPVTRMALTRDTWVTVLCRKLRDWWHWVADGDIPLVASHGMEIEIYKTLDPQVRLVILRALCDIRVEQDDIRSYIDNATKRGGQPSIFRKERIVADSHGISYWYEDDPVIGYRLYRETRKSEMKKTKIKGSHVLPCTTYQWETVATNFDEFQEVSEKLLNSRNRTEVLLAKKLTNDMLPEIEKVHKRKERLLKKQHRQALLLDNYLNMDGLEPGRSLRDRKPVTYTFDEYDRSINEAIKVTKKKPSSPDANSRREGMLKPEVSTNGAWSGPSNGPQSLSSPDDEEFDEDNKLGSLDRSNRRRQRPQRYSVKDFVEAVTDNEAEFDTDDDIEGEAVYDDEYMKKRKQRKISSSSEGDEEYKWDDENGEEEEEEEEEESLSISEERDEPRKYKKLPSRTRRGAKLRSVDELQSGLRRSKRATRNQIDYRQYEISDSEVESMKQEKVHASDERSNPSENGDFSSGNERFDLNDSEPEGKDEQQVVDFDKREMEEETCPPGKASIPEEDELVGVRKRRFLDLNELAPGANFDDGPSVVKGDDGENF